jgi:hypothetical protein
MKKLGIVRIYSPHGEVHFILQDSEADGNFKNCKYIEENKVKEIMKKQAAKPLLLLREE